MSFGCSLVVLAGGRSRRMGTDKAGLSAGQGTVLDHIVRRLAPVVDEVIVAGGSPVRGAVSRRVEDRYPGAGPLAGMHAGLLAARTPYAWVVACDMPDIEPALGRLLLQQAHGVEAVVPRLDGEPQSVCAIYDVRLTTRIGELLEAGEHSVATLLARSVVRYLDQADLCGVDPLMRSFRNLNTQAEYEAWLSSRSASG
jgi:molybdopterin-guanine dinucleotide biosynthesis protein A